MKIGILSLQGDFNAHASFLKQLGHTAIFVKKRQHLAGIGGLILPGGESSTHLRLLERVGLKNELIEFYNHGFPVFGTCAGIILMAREVICQNQFSFGFLPITIERNAYGTQKDSFTTLASILPLTEDFPCVFIRAPKIAKIYDEETEVLASHQNFPILVKHGNCLGATFHPELTEDTRIHQIFVEMCKEQKLYDLC